MTLIERAQDLLSQPAPSKFEHLLCDCLSAGNLDGLAAVQLLAEDMYGGFTFNFELKCPAAWCLVAWQEQGLQALVEIAQRTQTTKNYTIAFQILATLSARERFLKSWPTDQLRNLIEARVNSWDDTFAAARIKLNELARSISSDDDAVFYATGPIQHLSYTAIENATATATAAAKTLFLAMCTRWLSVGPATLSEYENILHDRPKDEPAFHRFFEDHSQLLDPMSYEVWSKPNLHGAVIPDFVIRRFDGTYLVVEIETPNKPLVTSGNQISAQTTHAINQVLHYREFMVRHFTEASNTFPEFETPECLVVIGLEQHLNAKQKKTLRLENHNRSNVRIAGFDWFAERARTLARNLIEGRIDVRRVRMP